MHKHSQRQTRSQKHTLPGNLADLGWRLQPALCVGLSRLPGHCRTLGLQCTLHHRLTGNPLRFCCTSSARFHGNAVCIAPRCPAMGSCTVCTAPPHSIHALLCLSVSPICISVFVSLSLCISLSVSFSLSLFVCLCLLVLVCRSGLPLFHSHLWAAISSFFLPVLPAISCR